MQCSKGLISTNFVEFSFLDSGKKKKKKENCMALEFKINAAPSIAKIKRYLTKVKHVVYFLVAFINLLCR